MLSLCVIQQSLRVDKIHKNNTLLLIIPTLSSKSYFLSALLYIVGAGGRKIVLRSLLMEFIEV